MIAKDKKINKQTHLLHLSKVNNLVPTKDYT